MEKSMLSMLFRLPAEIVLVGAFIASAYLKFSGSSQISWITPITLLIINAMYFYGRNLCKKNIWEI